MNLGDLAALLGLPLPDPDAASIEISAVAPIESAGPGQLTYLAGRKHFGALRTTQASAIICDETAPAGSGVPRLISTSPASDFARATRLLHPRRPIAAGIHPTAVVSPTATLGDGVRIGAYSVVGDGSRLGDGVEIHDRVSIYEDVEVGPESLIYAGCVLREGTRLGARCILQPNVVLGSDGFGFAKDREGNHLKIEQTGIVVVEDDVEIGAGSAVDRATFGETRIGRGSKIDNLVQIGHNSRIGPNAILCAQVGLAGSSTLGTSVTLAGQVGVAGHLSIGDGAVATAQTGIPSSIEAGRMVSGYPAVDHRDWLKSSAMFVRLPDLQKAVRDLRKRVEALESASETPPPTRPAN